MDASYLDRLKAYAQSLRWYHTIDLGGGIVTAGEYDLRPYLDHYGLPDDLRGWTALDIGASSGFFSFELERRGAGVTATELAEWAEHDLGPGYEPELIPEQLRNFLHDPFEVAKSLLRSRVERMRINIYDLSPERLGRFDLVFCGSVLLHLTDPLRALMRIRSVTGRMAVIATAIREEDGAPLAEFVGHPEAATWWLPNRACLEAMARAAGFERTAWISSFRLDYRDGRPGVRHGVIHAWAGAKDAPEVRKDAVPFGYVDVPAEDTIALGKSFTFKGWALDDVEVRAVVIARESIEADGPPEERAGALVDIGSARFIEGTRPDIEALYRAYPRSRRASWEFVLDRSMLPARGRGVFRIHVVAVDVDGHRATLGIRTVRG